MSRAGEHASGFLIVDDAAGKLPESVYITASQDGGAHGHGIELWQTYRDETALLTYSKMANLVGACGSGQPWIALSDVQVLSVCAELNVSVIGLDIACPGGHRYPELYEADRAPLEFMKPAARPEVVYVPSRPVRAGSRVARLELHPDERRRPILFAYTSRVELLAGCGPYQISIPIRVEELGMKAREAGAFGVLFNPVLAEQSRHADLVREW